MRFSFLICISLIVSCHREARQPREIERSFYYWRSVFRPSEKEQQALQELKVSTVYLKFFDVDWDDNSDTPVPAAQLRVQDSSYLQQNNLNVVPVVFITNETIFRLQKSQVNLLAARITKLCAEIAVNGHLNPVREMQVDCDWSASTRQKYFDLLLELKRLSPTLEFSATIRLHQVKYSAKTGIPPVNRGMLMCYNMGNLTNVNSKNSILEKSELLKYTEALSDYPLPLDAAFPLFSWQVLFRDNVYRGLTSGFADATLSAPGLFKKQGNKFEVLQDTLLQGIALRKGDVLRNEQVEPDELTAAISAVSRKIKGTRFRVSLYHLDPVILKKYSVHEMENMYDDMR